MLLHPSPVFTVPLFLKPFSEQKLPTGLRSLCSSPDAVDTLVGPGFLYPRVTVSDALSPLLRGCQRLARAWTQPPTLEQICMAPGVRTVTEHPGCPRPGCCSQPHPLPPKHPLWQLWEKGIAQSPPPRRKGCFRAGVPPAVGCSRQPPWKGYSWLFYKYIYIFFVARYCYLTSALGLVRGRIPTPGLAGGGWLAAPGGLPSALGVRSPSRGRLHCKAVHAFFF